MITAIFVFSCFVEFVFIVVESCCWFGFVFLVCSTLLRALSCAAHLIPPIQQQTDPLHSSVCPVSRLVLILYVASPREDAKLVFEPFFPCSTSPRLHSEVFIFIVLHIRNHNSEVVR
jgi:hypothetical protein